MRVLLAGIELVQVPGVTRLSEPQIARDLRAIAKAGAGGPAVEALMERHLALDVEVHRL